MICTQCEKKAGKRYRVNQYGDIFCDDLCYEKHIEINQRSSADFTHPYIDTYDYVRKEYIDRMDKWEEELRMANDYLMEVNNFIETIDGFVSEHIDFYITEGDDGIFAYEIYLYLLKFKELQKKIIEWRPKRDDFYTVLLIFNSEADFQPEDEYAKTCQTLKEYVKKNESKYTEKIINFINAGFNLENDRYTVDNDFELTFDIEEEAKEVAETFRVIFSEKDVQIYVTRSYLCDSGCGLYIVIGEEEDNLDGWHYDQLCANHDFPGIKNKTVVHRS